MVEKISNLMKNINLRIQGSQWISSRMHKYINIWIHRCQPDECGKRKMLIIYRGTTTCLISDFSSETMVARRTWIGICKVQKTWKTLSTKKVIFNKTILHTWRRNKDDLKWRLREFVPRSALQEILKEILL